MKPVELLSARKPAKTYLSGCNSSLIYDTKSNYDSLFEFNSTFFPLKLSSINGPRRKAKQRELNLRSQSGAHARVAIEVMLAVQSGTLLRK
jgi:hypothetical protein